MVLLNNIYLLVRERISGFIGSISDVLNDIIDIESYITAVYNYVMGLGYFMQLGLAILLIIVVIMGLISLVKVLTKIIIVVAIIIAIGLLYNHGVFG